MIATLNFEKSLSQFQAVPELEPGLRRIDELLAVVLARYEQADLAGSTKLPVDRFSGQGAVDLTDRPRSLAMTHPK